MSSEQEREAPRIPAYAMACIQAYGDARADDDGTSAARLGEAITELRKWAAAVTPSAPVAQWQKRHPDHEDGAWQNTSEGDAMWWRDSDEKWEIRALFRHRSPQARAVLPDGIRYLVPPLMLTGHQIQHLAAMALAADSLDAEWQVKELPRGVDADGEPAGPGIAARTDGQPGWAMLAAAPSAPERKPLTGETVLNLANTHGTKYVNRHFPDRPHWAFSADSLVAFVAALASTGNTA